MREKARVVVIDDEVHGAAAVEGLLREDGYEVAAAHDASTGLSLLEEAAADVVLVDLRLDGLDLLAQVKERHPGTAVVAMAGFGMVKGAVEAMKRGAEDCLGKPVDVDEMRRVLERALERTRRLREPAVPHASVATRYRSDLVGESAGMRAALETIRQAAPSSASVLLLGESGTGKELFAQALHQMSPRRGRPFVKVACAALPETLLESELFGHEKGAFTGATGTRAGRFELADGGTLFLDEIGDVSPTVQVKLLRFLEDREFERVGGNRTFRVDVRIVAATHRDLQKKLEEGTFREDLYYRLNVIQLHVPPLRERPGDIPLLAAHFMKRFAGENDKDVRGIADAALALLLRHSWPGNVRELENAVERAVVLATAPVLDPSCFPTLRRPCERAAESPPALVPRVSIPGSTLAELEKEAILRTLEAVGGSTGRAAELLQISARKIQYKLKEYHQENALRIA